MAIAARAAALAAFALDIPRAVTAMQRSLSATTSTTGDGQGLTGGSEAWPRSRMSASNRTLSAAQEAQGAPPLASHCLRSLSPCPQYSLES